MRDKLAIFATAAGAVTGLLSALTMRDHVRMVEILTLFFGGIGTGAGITAFIAARAARRAART
jgi:hypothetical protein